MKLKLISVGHLKDPLLREGVENYLKRIKPFVPIKVEEVREFPFRKGMSLKVVLDQEAEAIDERIGAGAYYVVLDERGKQKSTEEFKELFVRWENEGRKEVNFIIGGAYGLSESLIRGAYERLALSKMTFTHEMARLIFLEQVYRAYTILRGIPYHHGNQS